MIRHFLQALMVIILQIFLKIIYVVIYVDSNSG